MLDLCLETLKREASTRFSGFLKIYKSSSDPVAFSAMVLGKLMRAVHMPLHNYCPPAGPTIYE